MLRQGAILRLICVCVSKVTVRRATCGDGGLHRGSLLQEGVGVSRPGRSAAETAPANIKEQPFQFIYTLNTTQLKPMTDYMDYCVKVLDS